MSSSNFCDLSDTIIDFSLIKPVAISTDLTFLWSDIHFLYDDHNFLQQLSPMPSETPSPTFSSNWSFPSHSPGSVTSCGSSQLSFSPIEEKPIYFEPLVTMSEDRPHKCSYCPRAFSRRHDLERHTRVHTGAKPYQCPSCQKTFARSDARGRHFQSDPMCSQSTRVQTLLQRRRQRRSCNDRS